MSDFLSSSPCVLDILSYLDFGDLPNCYLTSRRIHDVIQTNPSRLPKPWISLEISSSFDDKNQLTITMDEKTKNCSDRQIISATGIEFNVNTQMEKYYQEGQLRVAALGNLNKVEQLAAELISVIFACYSVDKITVRDDWRTKKDCIPLISRLMLHLPRAKCTELHVHQLWPGLSNLTTHLGSSRVHVYTSRYDDNHTLAQILAYLPFSYTKQILLTIQQEVDSVEPIYEMIKNWQHGTQRLPFFSLVSELRGQPPFSILNKIAADILRRLEHVELKISDMSGVVVHFGRAADDRCLGLSLSSEFGQIDDSRNTETLILCEFQSCNTVK